MTIPQTPAPAAPPRLPTHQQPGRDPSPAGARADHSAGPAGDHARDTWRKALAAHNARARRGTARRRRGDYRAGMARRPPPPPDGDDAA